MRPAAAAVIAVTAAVGLAYAGAAQNGPVFGPGEGLDGADRFDARTLRLEGVAGEVEIVTGGVDRIQVEHIPGDADVVPPRVSQRGDRLEIAQLPRLRRISCRGGSDEPRASLDGGPWRPLSDYGRYVIHAPEGVALEIDGGLMTLTSGALGELNAGVGGCSRIVVDSVSGDASVGVNGSGLTRIGAVGGELDAAVNGSGSIETGAVAEGLDAAINGSGDILVASIAGDLDAAIRGSGDIVVRDGRAGVLDVAVMGSGDVRFGGVAETVDFAAFGSGDLYVEAVDGDVDSSSFGSGRLRLGAR